MPRAPSKLRYLDPPAIDDIADIKAKNPQDAQRVYDRIEQWAEFIQWGRVPQKKLTRLTGGGSYNFYRDYVGKSGYRVIYEISGDTMTVVAVLPKDDDTYDRVDFEQRMDRYG